MTKTENRPIQIVLVDDHDVVRAGLRSVFSGQSDFRLVAEAEDGIDAVRKITSLRPDVVILDLMLRGVQGLEVLRQVHKVAPRTRVVVLSMHSDLGYVVEAVRNGAAGYVLKSAPSSEVVHAIRESMEGRRYLSPPLSEEDVDDYLRQVGGGRVDPYDTLTPREREVFQLAAQGYKNSEIAEQLCIGRRTVETHRSAMMHKLRLKNQAELVAYAIRRGIVPPNSGGPPHEDRPPQAGGPSPLV
jgi:two-component system, NarL family, response regulator NreC